MNSLLTRRQTLCALGAGVARWPLSSSAAAAKPMRGIFPILATPYTAESAIDYDDLANEVNFMERCGAHGVVWPQGASEYSLLTREERMRGVKVVAEAARGKKLALVLGVQGPTTRAALEYAEHAEALAPEALIAIPPTEAKSLDDFRQYYRALAGVTKRPFFVQTTGGARGVVPTVEFLVELAQRFPNFGYVKEEHAPVFERIAALASTRPAIKAVFSGPVGLYEMRLGCDGCMPAAPYPDVSVQIWDLYQSGQHAKSRELYSKLLLMMNTAVQIPGTRQYIMKKRGVFKTTVSRREKASLTPEAIRHIDFNFEALRPYLRL